VAYAFWVEPAPSRGTGRRVCASPLFGSTTVRVVVAGPGVPLGPFVFTPRPIPKFLV